MAHKISDETIEYVGILAKLELSGQEKEDAKADMEKMLDYIDTLNEMDLEVASEFIIMASKLLEIKSRYLLYKQHHEEHEGKSISEDKLD